VEVFHLFNIMLIKTSYRDIPTKANGQVGTIRIYIIEPNVPEYPEAKFPGCEE
jgi:carboxymethylenebutenolidase